MSLREHDRTTAMTPLPAALSALLARVFSASDVTPAPADIETAWAYLGDLRVREQWLACDCRGGGSWPVLVPRRKASRMELVRLPREAHDAGCPFHSVRSVARPRDATPEMTFPVLLDAADALHEAVVAPRLFRLLLAAAEASGVHRVKASDLVWRFADGRWLVRHRDVPGVYEQFSAAVRALPDANGVAWGDRVARHPNGLRALRTQIQQQPASAVPSHGLFVGLVDGLGESRKGWTEGTDAPPMWLSTPTTTRGGSEGPFLGAAVHAKNDRDQVRGLFGVAQAVFARGLPLPLVTAGDRPLALALLRQMHYWWENHQVDVEMICPLHASSPNAEPSFVLTAPHGSHLSIVARQDDASPQRLLEERVVAERVAASGGGLQLMLASASDIASLPFKKRLSSIMLAGIPRKAPAAAVPSEGAGHESLKAQKKKAASY